MTPQRARQSTPRFVAVATYLLIVANAVGFYYEITSRDPDGFVYDFATVPYDIIHRVVLSPPSPAEPYATLVTALFMHANFVHIGSNMLFLFIFGPRVEQITGPFRFLVFYLLCGIVGNLALVVTSWNSHIAAIGASGAIAGVLGAYLIAFPLRPAAFLIALWAWSQFTNGFGQITHHTMGGGIAYFAHIGGFICGIIFIEAFRREGTRRDARYRPG